MECLLLLLVPKNSIELSFRMKMKKNVIVN